MHTQVDKESVLKIKYGRLVVETTAIWKKQKALCQVIDLKLGIKTKGVYYSNMCGYGVVFDGETITNSYNNYYGYATQYNQTWTRYEHERFEPYIFDNRHITDDEANLICKLYPDFKYVYKKLNGGLCIGDVIHFVKVWLEHKQDVEMLCALGFRNFVYQKSVYKLDKKKKDMLIKFLIKKATTSDNRLKYPYLTIKECIDLSKYNNLDLDYISLREYFSYDVYLKCYKKLETKEEQDYFRWHYKDYIKMCRKTEKDIKDPYWKYPKDLKTLHDRVMAEEKNYIKVKDITQFKKLEKRIKKYIKYNSVVNGYQIGFSADSREWQEQASALHQCIVAQSYYTNTSCLLVFIKKNNIPVATAELKANKEIGQFYGNEKDRDNCKPSEEVITAFNLWLEQVKVGARL